MSRIGLTERQWAFIRPLVPPPAHTGRPRADDRRTLDGVLYIVVTGCRWQDLPREYGAPTTVWRRLKRWGEEGVWERIWPAALTDLDMHGQLDWSIAFLDGSFAPTKKGGEHVGLTRKGKGTKWMLVVDGNGLPLGFHVDSAQVAAVKLAERTLDTVSIAQPRGHPKQRPDKLVADHGYDSRAFRRALRRRGIRMCIPPKRRPANWQAKPAVPWSRGRRITSSRTGWNAATGTSSERHQRAGAPAPYHDHDEARITRPARSVKTGQAAVQAARPPARSPSRAAPACR
jgi:transposase